MDSQFISAPAAPRRAMALKPIGRAALKEARQALAKYGLGESVLIEHWAEIVGPRWAGLTMPVHLNRHSETLTLRVPGVAALELMHQEREVTDRINTYCGRRMVKRLKLVHGPVHRLKAPRPSPRPLAAADEARLVQRASAIGDPALRAALLSLGQAIWSRRP